MRGDASDGAFVAEVLARAERDLGGLDLVVNATAAPPRDESFGGGPITVGSARSAGVVGRRLPAACVGDPP